MKISVVVPTYNEEKNIGVCLVSLNNQQIKADEIIVVDNNCTDKTVEIARGYNATVVKEPAQGMIQARNRGFNEAKFEIIARCDADVIVPPDWIKKIKENFSGEKIDALTGLVIFHDLFLPSTFYAKLYLSFMRLVLKGKETLMGPNMIITKEIWHKVKYKVCLDNKKVHEDIDLAIHILKAGGKIKRDDSLIVQASGRRIKENSFSFFIEYPLRCLKMLLNHRLNFS